MINFFKNRRVMVTGASGTIGSELIRQLLENYGVGEIVGLDNNESGLFFLSQEFSRYDNVRFFLADVRDSGELKNKLKDMHIVFHTAAFKHVELCEISPFEAVQTNILGVQNLIDAARQNNVERVIFTSSDKAVNPTNVMGTSKLMGERLMTAANSNTRGTGPIFSSTRFGNVLGSRGSVVPIFREQIRKGGPVTVTDIGMSRFIMTIKQAVQLVIDSAMTVCGGEVFVTKMPVVKVKDLADVMISELAPYYGYHTEDINIEYIGAKPGEKMYEELMNIEETRRTWELPLYFTVLPAFRGLYREIVYAYPEIESRNVTNPYHSGNEKPLTKKELRRYFKDNDLLSEDIPMSKHPK